MTSSGSEFWLKSIAKLRIDRSAGPAPHQPLLLLVVAELVEQNKLSEPLLKLTGELTFRFLNFWTVVADRRPQKPDIHLPFYHLKTSGVWVPLDETGKATSEKRLAVAVRIDEEFFQCLKSADFRERLRRVLIAKYFQNPIERAALYDLVGLAVPPDEIVKADEKIYEEAQEKGREARFRLTVIPAYDYTCALYRYRLITVNAGSIVDAAHIHQFADSRNNHPQNGIALSKNAHWMFDQGLWSLDDNYCVLVAKMRFQEAGSEALSLINLEGNQIYLPKDKNYWPDKKYLAWHRKNRFEANS